MSQVLCKDILKIDIKFLGREISSMWFLVDKEMLCHKIFRCFVLFKNDGPISRCEAQHG